MRSIAIACLLAVASAVQLTKCDPEAKAIKYFGNCDKDDDGVLGPEENRKGKSELSKSQDWINKKTGGDFGEDEFEAMLENHDADEDGAWDEEEFLSAYFAAKDYVDNCGDEAGDEAGDEEGEAEEGGDEEEGADEGDVEEGDEEGEEVGEEEEGGDETEGGAEEGEAEEGEAEEGEEAEEGDDGEVVDGVVEETE